MTCLCKLHPEQLLRPTGTESVLEHHKLKQQGHTTALRACTPHVHTQAHEHSSSHSLQHKFMRVLTTSDNGDIAITEKLFYSIAGVTEFSYKLLGHEQMALL